MKALKEQKILLGGVLLSIFVFFYKIYFISVTYPVDDEVYYFIWSKTPALGYAEHGPFLPWIHYFISLFLEPSGFSIRIPAVAGVALLSIIIFLFLKNRFGEVTGWISLIIFNLLPPAFFMSIVITMDTPMFVFLFISLILYYKGFFEDKKYLYAGGFFLGIAALSKIPGVIFGGALFCYVLFSHNRKDLLKTKEVWLSFILAALIYSPFIIWNYQHGFPFVVTALHLLSKEGSWIAFIEFWVAHFIIFLPPIFYWMAKNVVLTTKDRLKGEKNEELFFFAITTIVPFIYVLYKSLTSRLEINWGAFAYLGSLILVSIYIGKQWDKKLTRLTFTGCILVSVSFIAILLGHTIYSVFPYNAEDATNRYYIYRVFDEDLKDFYEKNLDKNLRIVSSNNYQIATMAEYFLKPKLQPIPINDHTYHPVVYEAWHDETNLTGQDIYYIEKGPKANRKITKVCKSWEKLGEFPSKRKEHVIATFSIFRCNQFFGKIRPLPTLDY